MDYGAPMDAGFIQHDPRMDSHNPSIFSARFSAEDSRPRTKITSGRYKTELCRAFQEKGTCKYGEKCQVRASHGGSFQN